MRTLLYLAIVHAFTRDLVCGSSPHLLHSSVDKLLDRAFQLRHFNHRAGFESSVLGKPGHHVLSASSRLNILPAHRHASLSHLHISSRPAPFLFQHEVLANTRRIPHLRTRGATWTSALHDSSSVEIQPGLLIPNHAVVEKSEQRLTSRGIPSVLEEERAVPSTAQLWDSLEFNQSAYHEIAGPDGRPLLVFVHPQSGGRQGLSIIKELQTQMHPIQVIDLEREGGPERALNWWSRTGLHYRVLVCGGDGTVGWLLGALEGLKLDYVPPVAILPLGTGNDLARAYGWGRGFRGSALHYLPLVGDSHQAVPLDRWAVLCQDASGTVTQAVTMCNYCGVGVDAAVALKFHHLRKQLPGIFVSRLVNKAWYGIAGATQQLARTRQQRRLAHQVVLECDGETVEIPEDVEGVVVMNVQTFAGGCDLWGDAGDDGMENGEDSRENVNGEKRTGSFPPPSLHDGKLEVVGVQGIIHLGAAQFGLYSGKRLAQASRVKITNKADLAVQVDGEPFWFAENGAIEISFQNQALLLERSAHPKGENKASAASRPFESALPVRGLSEEDEEAESLKLQKEGLEKIYDAQRLTGEPVKEEAPATPALDATNATDVMLHEIRAMDRLDIMNELRERRIHYAFYYEDDELHKLLLDARMGIATPMPLFEDEEPSEEDLKYEQDFAAGLIDDETGYYYTDLTTVAPESSASAAFEKHLDEVRAMKPYEQEAVGSVRSVPETLAPGTRVAEESHVVDSDIEPRAQESEVATI